MHSIESFTFGKWILIGTGLTFLAQQSDRLILGKLVSIETFWASTGSPFHCPICRGKSSCPVQFASGISVYRQIFGTAASRLSRHIIEVSLASAGRRRLGAFILVICTGDQVVLHLYDQRYRDAAWMVGVLAAGLWHTMLYSTVSPAILALSKAHYNAAANLVYCISLFALIPLGFSITRNAGCGSGRRCRRPARLLCGALRRLPRKGRDVFTRCADDRCFRADP